MAGFRSAAFWLGMSAGAVATQGGYKTPLPNWNAGATQAPIQGGFKTPLPGWNAGASSSPLIEPAGNAGIHLVDIIKDDEEILAIIQSFLHIRGDT